jgi:hypothetical protein
VCGGDLLFAGLHSAGLKLFYFARMAEKIKGTGETKFNLFLNISPKGISATWRRIQ